MTTPNDLAALAARMQEAQADEQQELLIEAFDTLYPIPRPEDEPEWQGPGTLREPLYHHWFMRRSEFIKMCKAEAYESAALMLVPERHRWSLHAKASGSLPFSYSAEICSRRTGLENPTYSYPCSTPALAIASAALLAHVENRK